ncbi:MAG: peptidase S16 [Alphaproteobacteria bacterium]|nr:peptidase S16 [Alphaproteobacteria bacterium]
MTDHPFEPPFARLPPTIPIFPLSGVLLLPRGRLPLNIFEPRYLAMTRDALGEENRLIGMIQPTGKKTTDAGNRPPIYRTGCAGRIVNFSESDDGRYQIVLAGVARFDVIEETDTARGYRRAVADWSRYKGDLDVDDDAGIERAPLLTALRSYLKANDFKADWRAIESAPSTQLVTTIAMVCPFSPSEKQALLESPDVTGRARILLALIEMSLAQRGGQEQPHH